MGHVGHVGDAGHAVGSGHCGQGVGDGWEGVPAGVDVADVSCAASLRAVCDGVGCPDESLEVVQAMLPTLTNAMAMSSAFMFTSVDSRPTLLPPLPWVRA